MTAETFESSRAPGADSVRFPSFRALRLPPPGACIPVARRTVKHRWLAKIATEKYHEGGELISHHLTEKYHTGGELAHDEVPIIGQIGEFMMQKPAHDYYGSDLFHALNDMRIPVEHLRFHTGDLIGAPSAGRGGAPISSTGSPQHVHIALIDDHRQAKKWIESREGQKHILRVAEQLMRQ